MNESSKLKADPSTQRLDLDSPTSLTAEGLMAEGRPDGRPQSDLSFSRSGDDDGEKIPGLTAVTSCSFILSGFALSVRGRLIP